MPWTVSLALWLLLPFAGFFLLQYLLCRGRRRFPRAIPSMLLAAVLILAVLLYNGVFGDRFGDGAVAGGHMLLAGFIAAMDTAAALGALAGFFLHRFQARRLGKFVRR